MIPALVRTGNTGDELIYAVLVGVPTTCLLVVSANRGGLARRRVDLDFRVRRVSHCD
jgi:hypothetical protein